MGEWVILRAALQCGYDDSFVVVESRSSLCIGWWQGKSVGDVVAEAFSLLSD